MGDLLPGSTREAGTRVLSNVSLNNYYVPLSLQDKNGRSNGQTAVWNHANFMMVEIFFSVDTFEITDDFVCVGTSGDLCYNLSYLSNWGYHAQSNNRLDVCFIGNAL